MTASNNMNTKTGKNIPSMQSDRHFLTPVIPQYSLLASESSWFYLYFFSVFFLLWHSCTPPHITLFQFSFSSKKSSISMLIFLKSISFFTSSGLHWDSSLIKQISLLYLSKYNSFCSSKFPSILFTIF